MSADRARVLVIADGGLPSLVACAAAAEEALTSSAPAASRPLVLPATLVGSTALARRRAIERQAAACGLDLVPAGGSGGFARAGAPANATTGEIETRDLLAAAFVASRLGVDRVVWPVQAAWGDDVSLEIAGRALDRALLVARLAAMDAAEIGVPEPRIETPYVDMTDRQLADLAVDLDAPVQSCWWWTDEGDRLSPEPGSGDEAAAEWRRWLAALAAAGFLESGGEPVGHARGPTVH